MNASVNIINGPNLNMLGNREPHIYGVETLSDIETNCQNLAQELNLNINFVQSNEEGIIVELIQQSAEKYDAIIINAGAYTHTSIAIHDALKASGTIIFEVHLSNIFRREKFRQVSYISELAEGVITGFGSQGYEFALRAIAKHLS